MMCVDTRMNSLPLSLSLESVHLTRAVHAKRVEYITGCGEAFPMQIRVAKKKKRKKNSTSDMSVRVYGDISLLLVPFTNVEKIYFILFFFFKNYVAQTPVETSPSDCRFPQRIATSRGPESYPMKRIGRENRNAMIIIIHYYRVFGHRNSIDNRIDIAFKYRNSFNFPFIFPCFEKISV